MERTDTNRSRASPDWWVDEDEHRVKSLSGFWGTGNGVAIANRSLYLMSGGNGGGDTRVPIPNTTVKTSSADDTWGADPWESRTSPGE